MWEISIFLQISSKSRKDLGVKEPSFFVFFVSYILFCFSEFGPVDSVKLFKDEFGESLGKAYVNFVNPEVRKSLIVVLFLVVREFFFFFMSVFCFLFVWYFV